MNDILDIIVTCSNNGILIDEVYLKRIIELLKKNLNLNNLDFSLNYGKGILFLNSILGTYYSNKITIYITKIKRYVRRLYYMSDFDLEFILNEQEFYLRQNLFILKMLLHEIQHYYQDIICKNNNPITLQDKLIILEENTIQENSYSSEIANKIYNNYNISFMERIAESNAYKSIIELITPIKKDFENIYNLQEQLLLERLIDGYIDNDSPTNRFFIDINKEYEFNNILNNYNIDDYDFNTRLHLGLNLTKDEYNKSKEFILSKKRV